MLSFECIKNEKSVYFLLTSAHKEVNGQPRLVLHKNCPKRNSERIFFIPLLILVVFPKKILFRQFCYYLIDHFTVCFAFQLTHNGLHDHTFILGCQHVSKFAGEDLFYFLCA